MDMVYNEYSYIINQITLSQKIMFQKEFQVPFFDKISFDLQKNDGGKLQTMKVKSIAESKKVKVAFVEYGNDIKVKMLLIFSKIENDKLIYVYEVFEEYILHFHNIKSSKKKFFTSYEPHNKIFYLLDDEFKILMKSDNVEEFDRIIFKKKGCSLPEIYVVNNEGEKLKII